jgi:hypothetical protein
LDTIGAVQSRLVMSNPSSPAHDATHQMDMRDPTRLRELASWYRQFAERAGSAAIWEGRLRLAGDLEAEADRLEQAPTAIGSGAR